MLLKKMVRYGTRHFVTSKIMQKNYWEMDTHNQDAEVQYVTLA